MWFGKMGGNWEDRFQTAKVRAELESVRAELLNDPHTLLLLPCITERLYKMSFTEVRESERIFFGHNPVGFGPKSELYFRACSEFLNIAKSLSITESKSFQRIVEDRLWGFMTLYPTKFHDVLAGLIISLGTVERFELSNSILSFFALRGDRELEESASKAMVVATVVVLLYYVCQYLMLFVDRGRGSRSYSSGSLDFRDVYISIVLFLGAYIWIKFRHGATSNTSLIRKSCETPGVYCRAVKDKSGAITHYKYEPKFKPPREKLDSGTTLQFNCLSLGQYDTAGEAKTVFDIAAFYYGKFSKVEGHVELEDGSFFAVPAMDEQEKRLTGIDKAKWVTGKAKQVFKDLQHRTVMSRKQRRTSDAHFDPSHRFVTPFPALSTSVDAERSETPPIELVYTGAERIADPGGSTHGPIPAAECSGAQRDVPGMENDAPEPDGHGNSSGPDHAATMSDFDQPMPAEWISGPANVSSQKSSLLGFKILGDPSPPQSDHDATQVFVGIPKLNFRQGWESSVCEAVEEGDQLLVSHQKKLLKEYAIRTADLQHQLLEADVKISKFQRENEQFRAAKLQDAVEKGDLQLRVSRQEKQLQELEIRNADLHHQLDVKLQRENEMLRAAKPQEVESQDEPWWKELLNEWQQEEGHQLLRP